MIKAAFINAGGEKAVSRVYSAETAARLFSIFDFKERVYAKEDIMRLGDIEVLFSTWGMPILSEDEIKTYLPSLKAVFYAAGSVQSFARPFLKCGIKVFSAWQANGVPVIEYAVSQIILANKGFFGASRIAKDPTKRREACDYFSSFPGNYDTKVGIIGLGTIGAGIAKRLKDYNIEVLAYDPYCSKEKADMLCVKLTSLEDIFKNCQTISNHVANLPSTKNMLDYHLFSLMKNNATFINTGRGAQVVEEDLVRALTEEPQRTAVLDVTDPEPSPLGHPFYDLANVILTPHIAGSSGNECFRMGEYMQNESIRWLNGEPLKYEVTEKLLETMA